MTGRALSQTYSVSPQIAPDDIPAIKSAGFDTVICNRPDEEVPPDVSAAAIQAATEAAGLRFLYIPFSHSGFGMDLIEAQDAGCCADNGKVFAYCASGNRCSILWAFGQAKEGTMTPDAIVSAAAEAGYDLRGLHGQLVAVSQG